MTDKTFTDEEIVKALECCSAYDADWCADCPVLGRCHKEPNLLEREALALINRQKAELADERAKAKMCTDVIARQDKKIAEQEREIARLKGETFYSPEDISNMTPKQIRENYSAIMGSMKKWS